MVFSSLFFLYAFLPLCLLCYLALKHDGVDTTYWNVVS